MFKKSDCKKKLQLVTRNIFESILYHAVKDRNVVTAPRRIVFVCTGNICRSAFAEKMMKAGTMDTDVIVESCGLSVEVSSPSPEEAIRAAEKIGLDLKGHVSKGMEYCNLENADLILAMEYRQYRKLVDYLPHKKPQIKLLREFVPFPENLLCNINDPFGRSQRNFEKCFAQIHLALPAIKFLISTS